MSTTSISQIANIDNFFYYGNGDLKDEIEYDLMVGLLQPKKKLFYFRSEGAGVSEYENYPDGLMLQISLRYTITDWISRRNTIVSNGQNNLPDRRVAISQNIISIESQGKGSINVSVMYIPLFDFKKTNNVTLAIGVNN
jgi:hypothetical protein